MDRNDPDYKPAPDPDDRADHEISEYKNSPEWALDRARAAFIGRRVAEHLADAIAAGQLCTPRDALELAQMEWAMGEHAS